MQDIMGNFDIAFPRLGIYLEDIQTGFSVFGFYIAFYGVIMAISVLAGILLVIHMAKATGQNPEVYWDFAIYGIVFSVIGARLYYVVFRWEEFSGNLWNIFNLRGGGLAIYGAVLAGIITVFIYGKIKRYNPLQIADTCAYGLVLGQIIGRWGNFINREVFGGYSEGLFAMRIPLEAVRDRSDITADIRAHIAEGTNYIQVHPTFLYESMWNLLVLAGLLFFIKYRKFHGEITLLYLGGYGLGRFIIEGMRTDRLLVPGTGIAVSQMVGILCFLVAVGIETTVRINLLKRNRRRNKPLGVRI